MYKLMIFLLLGIPAMAQVKLPAIISDNMVLQQQTTVTLWGWAKPGEKVNIKASWGKADKTVTADAGGKWSVQLKTAKAGGPYTLQFNEVEIKNVLLGEVWLASGAIQYGICSGAAE
jgi:sialate O-acetylesterase